MLQSATYITLNTNIYIGVKANKRDANKSSKVIVINIFIATNLNVDSTFTKYIQTE